MAKIRFYLTDKRAKGETKLFCNINYGLFTVDSGKKKYLPLKYTTNFKVDPKLWDADKNRGIESLRWADHETYDISQSAVEESARRNYTAFNESLTLFVVDANRIISDLTKNNRLPRHEQVRKELDRKYNPYKLVGSIDEVDYRMFNLVDYINHIVNTSTELKDSTKKNYKVLRNNILDYQKKHKGVVTPQNADIDFYNSFITFLTRRGLSKNTIGTRIKIIKTVLRFASEQTDDVCLDFTKESFKKPSEESESIYLTTGELNRIYSIQYLPPYLDRVRDMFLIGCDTGLRFSDLTRLTKGNITSDNTISIKTQKTDQKIEVPITPRVRNIFEKYNYELPKGISNQKYNSYLKDIAQIAGINEPIERTITKGGMRATTTVKKWELVTSHTARRSFATNAFLNGVPTLAIMKITGHRTESAFMKYIKMSPKDNAIKLQNHKFFTQMAVVK